MINKNSSKVLILLSSVFVFSANAQINLKLDRDLLNGVVPVIPLNGNINYDITNGRIEVDSQYPVICHRIADYQPASNLQVRILDPNGENKGDGDGESLMGGESNVGYNLSDNSISIKSENRSKSLCMSYDGFDLIYRDGFTDEDVPVPPSSTISYILNNPPPGGYTPGSIVSYDVIYENVSPGLQTVDLIEYYPYTSNSLAYFNEGGNVGCEVLDANDTFSDLCLPSQGVVTDIELPPNYKIKLSMVRAINNSTAVDMTIDLMATVYTKVATIDGVDSTSFLGLGGNISFSGFDKQLLRIPVVPSN